VAHAVDILNAEPILTGTIDEVPNGAPVVAADIRTITIR
jgi:hypothetical protein